MCYCDIKTMQKNSQDFDKKALVINLDPPEDLEK